MQKRSIAKPFVVLVVLFAGVWLYFAPYMALHRLQGAAQAGDEQAMRELVDFPSLRESVKQNVTGVVEHGIGSRGGPLAQLGGMLAGRVASPVVDAFVTPQGVAALTTGQRPGRHVDRDAGADAKSLRVRGLVAKRRYETLDRFVVHFVDRDSGKERLALVMHREGIAGWKLSGVRIPGSGANGD